MNHFKLITVEEFQSSEFWDKDNAGKEWNKNNLVAECITMASSVCDLICGKRLHEVWADWIKATDDETKHKVDSAKYACERLTWYLLRNGTDKRQAISSSISAGSMYFTTSDRQDPNYVPIEVWSALQETGLMNTEEQIDTVNGASSLENRFFKFHLNGMPDMGAMWKKLKAEFLNRTGIGSTDKTILVSNNGDTNAGIQVDLSIDFNSPIVSDKLNNAINNGESTKQIKSDIKDIQKELPLKANQSDLDTTNKNVSTNSTDIKELQSSKQDKLTSDNAGENITITKGDKGQVVINAVVDTDNIKVNGDKITATINGQTILIRDAIEKNTNDIKDIMDGIEQTNAVVADNKRRLDSTPYRDLDGDTNQESVADTFYELIPRDFNRINSRLKTAEGDIVRMSDIQIQHSNTLKDPLDFEMEADDGTIIKGKILKVN